MAPTLAEQMQRAREESATKARKLKPSDLLRIANGEPVPAASIQPEPAEAPRIIVIGGVTQCPRCRSTWILDDMRPNGSTRCYTCRIVRTDPLIIPGESLAMPIVNQAARSSSSVSLEAFIDSVTKAGFPQLAEMAIKYGANKQ
jgi:hypothetical protein